MGTPPVTNAPYPPLTTPTIPFSADTSLPPFSADTTQSLATGKRSQSVAAPLNKDLLRGNGIWVAGASGDLLPDFGIIAFPAYSSKDGFNWAKVPSLCNLGVRGISYANGVFLIGGQKYSVGQRLACIELIKVNKDGQATISGVFVSNIDGTFASVATSFINNQFIMPIRLRPTGQIQSTQAITCPNSPQNDPSWPLTNPANGPQTGGQLSGFTGRPGFVPARVEVSYSSVKQNNLFPTLLQAKNLTTGAGPFDGFIPSDNLPAFAPVQGFNVNNFSPIAVVTFFNSLLFGEIFRVVQFAQGGT
jgi:hypothetical protein